MVDKIKGEFGECWLCSNIDEIHGLQTIDKHFDVCITDPPYFRAYDGKIQGTCNNPNKTFYEDTIDDYSQWLDNWFSPIRKITKMQLIWPGNLNIPKWYDYEDPVEFMIQLKTNAQGRSSLFFKENGDTILMYGKYRHQLDFYARVIDIPLNKHSNLEYNHGCPKEPEAYRYLLERTKATSAIDPFMGAGTLALICEEMGIEWFGYELDKDGAYGEDIEKSIRWGQEARSKYEVTANDY